MTRDAFSDMKAQLEALAEQCRPVIKFKKLNPEAELPKYETPGAAGMDICALGNFKIWSSDYKIVHTGLAVEIPPGFEIQVRSRSGLAAKHGIVVLNSPGTIDSDYRGEIMVILYNHGPHAYESSKPNERIAQLVVAPVAQARLELVEELSDTKRGEGGLGSTGK